MEKEVSLSYLEAHVSNVEDRVVDEYDIFLAHDLDDTRKLEKKIGFYDAIGAACERLGLKPFIPYKFLRSERWGDLSFRDTHTLLHSMMIPKTRMFVCDLVPLSQSINEMKHTASRLNKPQIYYHEKGREQESSYTKFLKLDNPGLRAIIDYTTIREAIRKLEVAIKYNMPA